MVSTFTCVKQCCIFGMTCNPSKLEFQNTLHATYSVLTTQQPRCHSISTQLPASFSSLLFSHIRQRKSQDPTCPSLHPAHCGDGSSAAFPEHTALLCTSLIISAALHCSYLYNLILQATSCVSTHFSSLTLFIAFYFLLLMSLCPAFAQT